MADTINIVIKLREAARFAKEVRDARREIDKVGDSADRTSKKTKKSRTEFALLGGVFRQVQIAALIGGVAGALTLFTNAAGASGLALVGLIGAIGPLVGALGAVPALALGAAQALAVLLVPLMGVGAAVQGLNEGIDPKKFALLTPSAQKFALVLDALKPRVRGLMDAIGSRMFPGFTRGLIEAAPAIDALKGPLAGTGGILGRFVQHLGTLVGSGGFLKDLRQQAQFNNVQLRSLSGTLLHLLNALRHLGVGSRDLIAWMVKGVGTFAAWLDRTLATARATGRLQEGFHTVQVSIQRVGGLLVNLGVALFNIGRIGKRSIGDGILLYLLRASLALRRWTESERGVAQLTRAFGWARITLRDIRDLIVTIIRNVGPGAAEALTSLVAALQPLITSQGGATVLNLYAHALALIGQAAIFIEQNVPGGTAALSALAAAILLNKAIGIGGLASGMLSFGRAMLVAAVGTQLGATAFWMLDAALMPLILPIALVAAGVALLALGFYLAYTKIGWFHDAVVNVWNFIRKHWLTLGAILLGPFAPLLLILRLIIKNFGKIKGFLGGVLGKVGDVLGAVNPFAEGGLVDTPLQLVGERGPELAALPVGSRVYNAPATSQMLRAPTVAQARRAGTTTGGGAGGPVHLHATHVIRVDGKTLAKVVSDQVAKQKGRG